MHLEADTLLQYFFYSYIFVQMPEAKILQKQIRDDAATIIHAMDSYKSSVSWLRESVKA